MSTMTIRLPDDKHERLKALARSNSISVNRLMDELATIALADFDACVRFETRAARGNPSARWRCSTSSIGGLSQIEGGRRTARVGAVGSLHKHTKFLTGALQ